MCSGKLPRLAPLFCTSMYCIIGGLQCSKDMSYVPTTGLRGQEGVQKSRAADQTRRVSSQVSRCVSHRLCVTLVLCVVMCCDSLLYVSQRTFWTQASKVLRYAARLRILLIKCRQHMPISRYLPGKDLGQSLSFIIFQYAFPCHVLKSFLCARVPDRAGHPAVCVRGEEHPRGHSP